jgi:GNAT superfamily N-acetyltransferase
VRCARPGAVELALKIERRTRARGVREVAGLAAHRIREGISSEDTLIILVRDAAHGAVVAGGAGPASGPGSFRFKEAVTIADAQQFARDIGTESPRTFRSRLSDETRSFVVERDGRFLHSSWVTTACAWIREVRRYFECPSEGAYVYESYTRPEARGRGVYPWALARIGEWLVARGVEQLWVGIEAANPASLRAVTKAGFEEAFDVTYKRRLGRLKLSRPAGPLADLGARCLVRRAPRRSS